MKQAVYYLYEYESNHQVRNVGFVKCQQNDNQVVFQIHGKGLGCGKGERYEMNLFRGQEDICYISRAGHVDTEQGKINYMVTVDGVDEEVFKDYDGLYMHVSGMKKYVAMWTQKQVAFDSIESYAKFKDGIEVAVESEKEAQVLIKMDQYESCEEIGYEIGPEECEPQEHICLEEGQNSCGDEECVMEAEECCYDAIRRKKEEEHRKHEEEQKVKVEHVERRQHEESITDNLNHITYEKIERQDIAKLPQREWRLANNSFLLHGYHNYQHILFIQEAGRSFIGVPGVYSPREADAAKSFGFPVFHRVDNGDIDWEEGEWEQEMDFGYWCKEVSYRSQR